MKYVTTFQRVMQMLEIIISSSINTEHLATQSKELGYT